VALGGKEAVDNRDGWEEVGEVDEGEDHVGEVREEDFEDQLVCVVLLFE
jgi:hypothetical protein